MTTEAQITAWLATQQDAMLAELKEMVNTDGGSYDKAGVDRTGAQVKRFLEGHGILGDVDRIVYGWEVILNFAELLAGGSAVVVHLLKHGLDAFSGTAS